RVSMRRVWDLCDKHISVALRTEKRLQSSVRRSETAATGNAKFARVNWPSRHQFARIKMKRVDADHSGIELGVRLQEFPELLRGDIAATSDRDVRMPWTKLRFDTNRQRGLLHALMNLEQMRMRFAHTDPDNFRRAF